MSFDAEEKRDLVPYTFHYFAQFSFQHYIPLINDVNSVK